MEADKKYKIGSISKLLGIPIQTLHYYEKCGFVSPAKNKETNYRYYDTWDVNYLLDCKYLRSFEFSIPEVEELINKDTLEQALSRFGAQEKELLKTLYHYQSILDELHAEKQRLLSFQNNINCFSTEDSPKLLFNRYRLNNFYQAFEDQKGEDELPQITSWLNHMPFVKATFKIPYKSIQKNHPDKLDYWWGFSISIKKAMDLKIYAETTAEYVPSQKCIYTVFTAHGQHTFSASLYNQVLEPIWKMGYEVGESPIGRLLIRTHDNGEYTRYFEIWVPVHTKDDK